ncbi:MAG TPA: DUF5985 family protein [Alphaproteobacteria bacterium]|jgi:hypothetical protein|nr:DUF5985 family protein [Alphaproteobacteria bacterium]
MATFPAAVYLLCLATSLLCTYLLIRSYRRSRTRLLMWTALCFVFLAANNLSLVADLLVFPEVNLLWLRQLSSLGAVVVLVYGFVWEAD